MELLQASTYLGAGEAMSSRPTVQRATRFLTLERVLAGLCALTPFFLWAFNDWSIRGSISAHHDMKTPEAFFYPLSVGAMLFIVNGVIKTGRLYNTALGVALSGVVLFNHDGWTDPFHVAFAVAFFVGNVAVIVIFAFRNDSQIVRIVSVVLAIAIALAMLAHFGPNWISLFWAESMSLAAITIHYLLDAAKRVTTYNVTTRKQPTIANQNNAIAT